MIRRQPIYVLLLALPLAAVGEWFHWNHVTLFLLSILGIIPLAKLLGDATEALAAHTGPRISGLLNATLGNAAELIITIMALRAGLVELVKASITGSIIGNVLFVMGGAILLGGLRHGIQHFDRTRSGLAATQLALGVIALAIPTLFAHAIEPNHHGVEMLSLSVAVVMMVIYVLGLVFSLSAPQPHPPAEHAHHGGWSVRTALLLLALSTVGIVWMSEILVKSVEYTVSALGVSEFFIGIIVVPIVGNAAEHLVAVTVALKDQMDLSLEITLGSSTQIALFVAPLLVLLSVFIAPEPLTLVFHPFELAALAAATVVAALIAQDGKSNWMEGAQLLGVFLIIALAFYFV
ncbi:MAG: calcium/proton exchanger [Chloroflexi bacterium]|nr:calcium/proton exchanger [Chloroflexota bacterium]